jgi:hypothetical protein
MRPGSGAAASSATSREKGLRRASPSRSSERQRAWTSHSSWRIAGAPTDLDHARLPLLLLLYLLRLLNVIDTPFKVGQERTDDDVSLFLLTEFMVHAQAAGTAATVPPEDVEAQAAAIEEQLVEVEEEQAAELEAAEEDAAT